jgi:hypothetical protein
MLIVRHEEAQMKVLPLFERHLKPAGYRVIHRAGCGAQPTHPRPALWITRMAPNGLGI